MANEEQLAILKQGVDVWNRWREENPNVDVDLTKADFIGIDLREFNLDRADLGGANLSGVNLCGAYISKANLIFSNLSNADLSETDLRFTDFTMANLSGAKLMIANLNRADFNEANLSEVSFGHSDFVGTNLSEAVLSNTFFSECNFGNTIFGKNDLSTCLELGTAKHIFPSTVGTDTIQRSKGKIPVEFLRGCGLSDLDIEYAKLANPDLSNEEISEITQKIFDLKATQAIQISPLFISYCHANSAFVDRIETKLNDKGIRFWRDIHNATAGRLETQIDRAIRHNPTVLLILSEHSTNSDWVEHEARLARKLEKELGREVLCPIALDDSWKTCNWPERIKEQIMEYNILDFSNWEDDAKLDVMFKKLVNGLDMFYKR